MLINASHKEEIRVALVEGQSLYDLDIERTNREQKKANIYKGKITRIEPSLEAAFIDFGSQRHGFLPLKEISREHFVKQPPSDKARLSIRDVIQEGQELLVQVVREERGSKGAALTTFISLAGCYLVLMPNNPRAGGISRRIEGEERSELKEIIDQLEVPQGMGVIIRTAGVGKDISDLQWDLSLLIKQWEAIKEAGLAHSAPVLIHQESDVILRAFRDYLRKDVTEVLVDNHDVFAKARNYIQKVRPDFINKIKLYQDTIPLFSRFQIESQIESAYHREVRLPSGGEIVIDRTEALVAIDINSGKDTKGSDIEQTALNTNLEAADEIARQLRLRDLGGLVVIDFIDMGPTRNQREVENRLRDALRVDRARIQIGRISRFGMLEMSRQRLRPALNETFQKTCPRCNGGGNIRGVESLTLSLVRVIEEEALKENTGKVQVQLPFEVATFLINEKRHALTNIEKHHRINIVIIPNPHLETPHYIIERIREDEVGKNQQKSYEITMTPELEVKTASSYQAPEQPAIKGILETADDGAQKPSSQPGLVKRLWQALFGSANPEKKEPQRKPHHHKQGRHPHNKRQGQGRPQGNRSNSQNQRRRHSNRGPRQDNRQQENRQSARQAPRQNEARQDNSQASRQQEARQDSSQAPRQHETRQDNRAPQQRRSNAPRNQQRQGPKGQPQSEQRQQKSQSQQPQKPVQRDFVEIEREMQREHARSVLKTEKKDSNTEKSE